MENARTLRVAVEGCGHGTLNAIYASVQKACQVKDWDGVDLLIIGGDFQAIRNASDLNSMAMPAKYREIGDFHEYYSGARVAPYLTIFIGGNHEASNHLWELYYGGWVAPNIYYLGAANVLKVGRFRIAGQSGIWKGYNYKKSHHERLPYSQDDVRSIYHVRELDTRKLLQIRSQVDIGLSHDWPRGVEWLGDWKHLFRKKDLFEADARAGNLGSVAAKLVLERLRPRYWFSAHLHIKYAALVDHVRGGLPQRGPSFDQPRMSHGHDVSGQTVAVSDIPNDEEIALNMGEPAVSHLALERTAPRNEDEIDLDTSEEAGSQSKKVINTSFDTAQLSTGVVTTVSAALREQLPASFVKHLASSFQPELNTPNTILNTTTRFLALDKCLPRREFLQLIEIETEAHECARISGKPLQLSYDPEWLAITRVFANELHLGDSTTQVSLDMGRSHYLPLIEKEEQWVEENIIAKGRLLVPDNFSMTAPSHDPKQSLITRDLPREHNNPQTVAFCALLEIINPFAASEADLAARHNVIPAPPYTPANTGGGRGRGMYHGRNDRGRSGRGSRDGGGRPGGRMGRGRGSRYG